jgi:uncharacterized lipoprotein YehR (DUF1307 family)
MKAKKILNVAVLALLTGAVVVSCNDSEEQLDVLTDVYAINKKFGNEVKSATAYYAYANQTVSSVTVTIPNNGGKIELESSPGTMNTMTKKPKDADFKATAPVKGSYAFTIKGMNGETIQVPDVLNYENLAIPQFTKIKFSGTPSILELEWNVITNADGYFVKMFDLDGNLILSGYNIKPDANKYIITSSANSGYWSQAAVDGKSYLLQLNAFINDSEATLSNYIYNISEISLCESQIKWGLNE